VAEDFLERWVNVGGIKTHYLTSGHGPAIVLLHGGALGVSAEENWGRNLGPLAAGGFSVWAPEIVGSGSSDKPAGCHAIAAKVRHIKEFIDLMCLERVSIVGNALGASLALSIAHDWPQRVTALVIMGGPGVPHGDSPPGLEQLLSILRAQTKDKVRQALLSLCVDPSLITEEIVDRRYRLAQLPGAREAFAAFISQPEGSPSMFHDVEGFLPELKLPVLLLWGREDRIQPLYIGERVAARLPNAKLEVVENCGHWVQVERADVFNRQVANFCRSAAAAR
jgi:pimeloyl-ACP methyl ester carboxylesterase